LAQAVAALREQLGIANRRIDELQAMLAEERRRLIMLLTDRRPWWRRCSSELKALRALTRPRRGSTLTISAS
jgi:hypothetical protein